MLIAVSGSQGSGKTTTIKALGELGYPHVERKTSRSILDEWGITLRDVNYSSELTAKFQEELVQRKFQDDLEAKASPGVWFTERTFADVFVYALITLGKHNHYSQWLNTYHALCAEYQQIYDHVFYLTAGHFDVRDDGVRGTNQHYSTLVDQSILHNTRIITDESKLTILNASCLNDRVTGIMKTITNNNNEG